MAIVTALVAVVAMAWPSTIASGQPEGGPVHHTSLRVPVLGPGRDLGAKRAPGGRHAAPVELSRDAHRWQLVATIPGAVIHDISFATPKIGYAAAELGQVWKTDDGGTTWREVLNLGFPFYWYGVHALTPKDVVVSGFDDSNFTGILRWTHDGGTTWTDNLVITTDGWSNRIRFVGSQHGLVIGQLSLDSANEAQYTTDGGGTAQDWTTVTPDPGGGWFGADFTFLADGTAYISGITECISPQTGGATWRCRPSVDPVFDGAVEFVDHRHGWVGGGEIAPNVEGWVHVTTDGGRTWSGRTLDGPWPIRELHFLTPNIGWAAGGNLYSNVGGLYFSNDGGQTWSLDADTGAEMSSCDHLQAGPSIRIWCSGYTGSLSGVIYSLSSPVPANGLPR
jgi:photosystem II stability/assembly factor-like uncharacterized protein